MEQTSQCWKCRKSFEVLGEGGAAKRIIEISCPYCHAAVSIEWPTGASIFVRYIPEQR